jgi:hypothetical protein
MLFKSSVTLFLGFLASASAGSLRASEEPAVLSATVLFHSWVEDYGRDYGSDKETMNRLKVWMENHGMSFVVVVV